MGIMTEEATDTHVRELFARVARGDESALAQVYDENALRLHGYARALVRTEGDADEVLQEVFLGLARSRDRLAAVENPVGYLFRAARNAAFALARASRRTGALDEAAEPIVEARDGGDADEANALLARLPGEQREVIVLKVYSGLTFREIAEALGVPANTVASRYRYAIERLRESRGGAR
jgi:RNA polymerase sigma-70 factor (ECF subfamily)